ncbi:MAG: YqeG family HAD IIIA-type phosphatase [Vulcanimicrobiaceae bacterium]
MCVSGVAGGPAVDDSEDSEERGSNATSVFRPDGFAPQISLVSLDDLSRRGFRGIIVDLDNTLVGYGEEALARDAGPWIAAALARGFRVCLVSNNFTERVGRICAELGVPGIPSALKPLPRGFLAALRVLGTSRAQTVVVGDQLFTDVLGAKFLGMHAILTEPIVARDWLGTRLLRLAERLVLGRRVS